MPTIYECPICKKQFVCKFTMSKHVKNQICIKMGRICPICKQTFQQKKTCAT